MAKALEIISPDEIYSDLIFKDPVPPHTIYTELMKLIGRNASNERIADRTFDFFSSGLMDDSATEEQYNALYDLTLLEEPGMELNKDEIMALIHSLK
ncbi:TPA: hypothetical protein ACJJ5Z_000270 [Neisseria meningitidis]